MTKLKVSLVPEIRFKSFTEKWVEEPILSRIRKIVDFRGRTPKKLGLNWSNKGYLALSALNVKDGYIDSSADAHFGNEELYNAWMMGNELHYNQVLFTTEAPMGNVAQVPDYQKYILSQRTLAFVTDPLRLSEDYLAILLKSPTVFNELIARSSGGTAKGVSQKSLSTINAILSDDIYEQAKIGFFFKQLDKLIQFHQQKHDKLVTLKQAMLQKMFPQDGASIPEIRFKGFQGDWNQKKLGEIATFSKGTGYSKSDLIASGVPIVLYGRLYTNYETEITKVDTFVLEKSGAIKSKGREVVVPASGETSADIARASAIMTEGIILGGDMNIIIPSDVLESSFLALTLSSGKPQQDLARRAQGKSVVHVRKADIEEIVINYPKTDEQTKIILYFRNINRLIANHSAQLEKMKQLKSACLAKMFV